MDLVFSLIDGLESCGYLVMFLSAVWTHSDGTHSLQGIHWFLFNAKFLKINSDEERNSFTSWMARGWIHFQQHFWVNYSFKTVKALNKRVLFQRLQLDSIELNIR